jgi:ribonucleoside-diphosphate reductase alpha chain
MALKTRPIGLGLVGFADILYKLKIPYNSKESRTLFSNICQVLTSKAIMTSIEMCSTNGKDPITIPEEDKQHLYNILRIHLLEGDYKLAIETIDNYGIRNSTWTSIAPSGSLAVTLDSSYAFEPHFALVYEKHLAESDEVWTFVNQEFEKELDKFITSEYSGKNKAQPNHSYIKQRILQKIKNNKGSCQSIEELPEEIRKVFVTAHDISPIDKLEMQAAGQKYISLGISSTCNLPCEATVEDVANIYTKAWELGLKGITVYRDGCKENQPISFGKKECKEMITSEDIKEYLKENKDVGGLFVPEHLTNLLKNYNGTVSLTGVTYPPEKYERPTRSFADHFEYNTNYGKLHIEICKDSNGKIFQTLIRIGKQGSLTNMLLDSLSRCISKALQEGVDLNVFAKTLRGNKEIPFWIKIQDSDERTTQVESIIDLIGMVFQMITEEKKESIEKQSKPLLDLCPNCNEFGLSYALGCKSGQCVSCGYSSCS